MRTPGGDQDWFVVLADHDAAAGVPEALRVYAPQLQIVPHPSGRPWLMGRWAAGRLASAEARHTKVAVIGCCPVTTTALSALARAVRTVSDLDRLAPALPGSFHLIATIGGQVRAQGSISGLRRVFHARIAGVTVAADRADVLAGLAGAGVNEQQLAIWLLAPLAPHPLIDACGWQGVHAVPSGCYLLVDGDGSHREVAWWHPPEPVAALAEAAPVLREALCTAVEARTRAGEVISADLSGGLDSTTLCFLAAHGASRMTAVTLGASDPGNDDVAWAKSAARELDGVEHLVFGPEELPSRYAKIGEAAQGQDSPFARVRSTILITHLARMLLERGCRLHLAGHGGDEVLQARTAYLHTTVRTHPRITVDHLRGWRARRRWSLSASLRGLADRRTYPGWLIANAGQLAALPPPRMPPLGWGQTLQVAPWATRHALDAAATLLRQAAESAEPLAPSRGQHATLQTIRGGAYLARHAGQVMARAGLPLEAPYFDDRVVEACLAVRLHERTTPWRYKPLLVEAMRGVVPARALARTTKGGTDADVHAGLRRYRADLAALCDDLVLAQLGLVDAEALRAACLGPHPPTLSLPALEMTLGCEAWLRTRASAAPRPAAFA